MSEQYYLIRTPTLAEIKSAISQNTDASRFPSLSVIDGKEFHFIHQQTLVDIADIIREKSGTTETISVTSLATRIRVLDSSILGKAILGAAVLGKGIILGKLDAPVITLVSEKLDTPVIALVENELDAPVIRLVTDKLDAPTIRLEPYTELAYLEGTGTQYIDTGVHLTDTLTNIEAAFEITSAGTQYVCSGGETASTNVFSMVQAASTTNLVVDIGSNSGTNRVNTRVPMYGTGMHTVKVSNKEVFVDGTSCGTSTGSISGTVATPLYLFANCQATSKCKLKMSYFKIWDGNVLVRDFIPVLDSKNVPCMYDKVSGEFFYNQGTGAFQYGTVQ